MNKVTLRSISYRFQEQRRFPLEFPATGKTGEFINWYSPVQLINRRVFSTLRTFSSRFIKTPPWFVFLGSRSTWKFPKWGNNSRRYSKSTWSTLEFSAQLGNLARKNSDGDRHFSSERVVEGCTCRYIALIRKAREKTCLFLKLVILRSTQMINSSTGKCFSSMCNLLWCIGLFWIC